MSEHSLLLKIDKAKEILAIGETKLRELMDAGLLDAVKIGRATRITSASVQALISDLSSGKLPPVATKKAAKV